MTDRLEDQLRISELEADNRRLRRLLDTRDAPGELRHRLRSTVAMLRTIIRRTAETERDFDAYVGHLEDRLDALMRAQAAADDNGSVSLHHLLADELAHYGVSEGERVSLLGRDVEFQPRAGQVMAMAIHELTINALEHGDLDPVGRVSVRWWVTEDTNPWLTFNWEEESQRTTREPVREGFGMELLRQVLGYELKAEVTISFDPEGFRCSLRFPFTEQVGHVARED
ncbi:MULTISPECIES: sensor histidine kinase [Sphingobium]|uniref:sensor histidine kinase n=1 Tax=Sphingobium TaxID=165695 RepID=UPI001BEA7ED8|nr:MULTISPECIES: sensor histidine kinase [Sphingobium]MBT2245034.1 sensor histidine kinase [Sphingobium sp. BHU LFT2]WBQ19393.1 sensor histidine kinase [Sphingobium yanoikuyae]